MKVLLINTLYEPYVLGGAERSVRIIASYLKSRGITPVVATTFEENRTEYVDGIKVYYIKTPNVYWPYRAKEKSPLIKPIWHLVDSYNPITAGIIGKLVAEEGIDVMHTNNLAGFSTSVWSVDIPKVHTLRDFYLMCIRSTMFRRGRECKRQCPECKLLSIPRKVTSRKVDAVTGISRYILDKHLSNGYFKRAGIKETVYNPIEKISTPRRPGFPPVIFGYAGSLTPHKGIEFLLKAFSKVRGRALLLVFGKSPNPRYESYLRENYESERVRFMGFLKPDEIYPMIHVLIVPSLLNEPFGRVIPEAYAHGVPVIASRRGGIPEIVRPNETGLLFRDMDELISAMEFFMENPHEIIRMGDNALEFAKRFLPENTIEKFIAIYEEIKR